MPFVPAPNIVQVEWRQARSAQQMENRMMIDILGEPHGSQLLNLATVCWDWWENTYADVQSNQLNLASVVATYMGVADGEQVTYAPDTTTFGTITGTPQPNENSFCVTLSTGHRGRSARGRWYTCSVNPAQMNDANNLNAVDGGLIVSALQTLINAIIAEGYVPSIVSYITNNAPRVGGPVYFPIVSAQAKDLLVDSQKRRKPGVGS